MVVYIEMIPQLLIYSIGPAVHGFGLMGLRALCSGCGARRTSKSSELWISVVSART